MKWSEPFWRFQTPVLHINFYSYEKICYFIDSGPSVKISISCETEIPFYISFHMKTDISFSHLKCHYFYFLPFSLWGKIIYVRTQNHLGVTASFLYSQFTCSSLDLSLSLFLFINSAPAGYIRRLEVSPLLLGMFTTFFRGW